MIVVGTPDDWHLHLRQDSFLADTVPPTAKVFRRAIIMPNLSPPVTTVAQALAYRSEIIASLPGQENRDQPGFEPLMTLFLKDDTSVEVVREASISPHVHGIKLYPQDATTGSVNGVSAPEKLHHLYEVMAETGLPLLVHGEKASPEVDVFDRERLFIDTVMRDIADRHPGLRIVLEHITTQESVDYVLSERRRMLATITPHHLWLNRNAIFPGSRINPHHFCLPVLKREHHRLALVKAATSGEDCFAAGTDSAPHLRRDKESSCGCAGIFNAPCALETYAEIFEREGALGRLEGFVSRNGAHFYGLPVNPGKTTLKRRPWRMPAEIAMAGDRCIPFRASEEIAWTVEPS